MKSFTSIVILCLFLGATSFAQPGNKAQKEERIRSLRIAFITDKLQLTPKESEQFWPIYNEYSSEKRKLMKARRNTKKPGGDMTDKEADAMVDASFALQEQQLALKRTYFSRLRKVISPKKLVLLEKAEKQFRQKVVKEIKRRKQGHRKKNKR